jgi:hypothetical protein
MAPLAIWAPPPSSAQTPRSSDVLTGAWRASVRFNSGALAATKDLEFMYAFAAGGTLTESSNYDAAPPVPPAYGVWRKVGPRRYEARYQFYQSKALSSADELVKGGGWAPDGYGILTQRITLSKDGQSFDSTITLELFDSHGKVVDGGGRGSAAGQRMGF